MNVWTLTSLWLALLLVPLAGCATRGPSSPPGTPSATRAESLQRMDPVRIEADTMGFADRYVTTMSEACDELERDAPTAAGKDAALRLKTDMAIGAVGNAVNPRSIAGMMNMVAMVTLQHQVAEDPWAAETFGPTGARRLAETLARQEEAARVLASQYMTDEQLAELNQAVTRWHRAHPDEHYVSHVRLLDLPEANRAPAGPDEPPSVFTLLFIDPTAKWAPALRETTLMRGAFERAFFFLQRWPMLLRWQAEGSLRRAVANPQFARAAGDISSVAGSTTRFVDISSRFADVGDRFTDLVARFPQQLSAERDAAVLQFSSEVTRQREAAIRQLADAATTQREAAIAQATTGVAAQRQEAIQQLADAVAAQREKAIQQAAASLRGEQQIFVANLEAAMDRSINRMVWRSAGALAVLLILWTAAAAVVYRLWHRSREDPPGSTRPGATRTSAGRKWSAGDEAGGTT